MALATVQFCRSCLALGLTRADFETPPFVPEGKYRQTVLSGTIGDLRNRETECGLCRLLLCALSQELRSQPSSLSEWDGEWEAEWLQSTFEYDPDAEDAEDRYGSALYPKLKGTSGLSRYGVQLVENADTVRPLTARRTADEPDINRVRSWIRRCHNEHGPQCAKSSLVVAGHPLDVPGFFVIDVQKKCLTALPRRDAEYVTLSYVWGATNFVNTTTSNLELLSRDGAFDRVRLPKTLRDAVDVTTRLGYRFLWVDAVCIVQDNEETKPLLIANMDAVYGNAALTIVAASGNDAAAGFLHSRNESDTETGLVIEDISPGFSLAVAPFFDGELMDCAHAQRGWTYQEGCLSTRCLVFLDGLVYFVCRASVWREDMMAESSDFRPFDGANVLGTTASEWPLRRYADHVQAFTSRQLTYQSDVLNAFSGVEKALSKSMNGTKMWYGLPAAAFDWAILWTPPLGQHLTRRSGFPSWSWSGWTGPVTMAVDSWSEYDQKWLRERTWIEWFIADSAGNLVPIWGAEPHEENKGKRPVDENRAELLIDHHTARNTESGACHTTDEDEDDEEDDEFMPEYDALSMVNGTRRNFAREVATKLCNKRPDAPVHDRPIDNGRYGPPPAGSLCFYSLFTMSFMFKLEPTDQRLQRIIGTVGGQLIGYLCVDSGEIFDKSTPLAMCILSFATPGVGPKEAMDELRAVHGDVREPNQSLKEEPGDGTSLVGSEEGSDLLNVMLLRSGGGESSVSQRGGLGFIHYKALKILNVNWAQFRLG